MEISPLLTVLRGSKDYSALLKVCIASQLTGAALAFGPAGEIIISPPNRLEKKRQVFLVQGYKLTEANAALRYLMASSRSGVVGQNQLIEWEERVIQPNLPHVAEDALIRLEAHIVDSQAMETVCSLHGPH
jgi:hypothetical protein